MFQDSVDPMDPDVVLRTIVDELGKHPDELFVDFGQ
jgi:predicted unusual protein kinase regulating ubiquinone biosynthesis (AarF/ABC1/UbiB family)